MSITGSFSELQKQDFWKAEQIKKEDPLGYHHLSKFLKYQAYKC